MARPTDTSRHNPTSLGALDRVGGFGRTGGRFGTECAVLQVRVVAEGNRFAAVNLREGHLNRPPVIAPSAHGRIDPKAGQ